MESRKLEQEWFLSPKSLLYDGFVPAPTSIHIMTHSLQFGLRKGQKTKIHPLITHICETQLRDTETRSRWHTGWGRALTLTLIRRLAVQSWEGVFTSVLSFFLTISSHWRSVTEVGERPLRFFGVGNSHMAPSWFASIENTLRKSTQPTSLSGGETYPNV